MATITGRVVINGEVYIVNTDTDPSTGGGTPAEIGMLAISEDDSGVFVKKGSGNTDWFQAIGKYFENTGFTAAVAKTITHNLNTTKISSIMLFDTVTGLLVPSTVVGNRTANTIDITIASTLASVDVIISG